MALQRTVIDTSEILGQKVFCGAVPAGDPEVNPLTVEIEFNPGAEGFMHIHPEQDESYEVLSGTLDLFLNGRWTRLGPGESLKIPKGSVHAFRNSSDDIVRATNIHDPALRFKEHLEVLERLIREGKLTGTTGFRNGMYLSLHTATYRREVISVRPPDRFIRAMARLAKFLGYKL